MTIRAVKGNAIATVKGLAAAVGALREVVLCSYSSEDYALYCELLGQPLQG